LEIDPKLYAPFVIYVLMNMALYGMIFSSLLFYKKFKKDVESIGFQVNHYEPCVANRLINGKQHTLAWHVDDIKSSHVDSRVNDEFGEWLKTKYASDNIGKLKITRGNRHEYLGMVLDYSTPGVLKIDMTEYVKAMVKEFPYEIKGKGKFPWNDSLFKVDEDSKKLELGRSKVFHTFVMKGMFLAKRGRQDILPGIAFLATRTKEPTEEDWNKLLKILNYLQKTQDEVTQLEADDKFSVQ